MILLISSIFLVQDVLFCSAHSNEGHIKSSLVEEIVQKVCNLSLDSFSHTPPEEKAKFLLKIEEKLNKSALSLGSHSRKYVQMIMQGIKLKAFANSVAKSKKPVRTKLVGVLNENKLTESTVKMNKLGRSELATVTNKNILRENTNDVAKIETATYKTKKQLIDDIASKIERLTKEHLKYANNNEQRLKLLEVLKKKIGQSADRQHTMIHSKHDEIKSYINLITQGIDLLIKRNKDDRARRMDFVFMDNIKVHKVPHNSNEEYHTPAKPKNNNNAINRNDLDQGLSEHIYTPQYISHINDHNSETNCKDVLQETCHKITALNSFNCHTDNREMALVKICDGTPDCIDYSDEKDCARQAMDRIHSAGQVMSNIDVSLSRKCYTKINDNNIISKQTEVLRNVLQVQLDFLQKHALDTSSPYSRRLFDTDSPSVKKTVNEVVTVVGALSLALDGALCFNMTGENRRHSDLSDIFEMEFDNKDATATSLLKSCTCNGQYCSMKECQEKCNRMCWQKYSLSQWQCKAVNGDKTVSLDLICDGKLDCYDESDEMGCSSDTSLDKFEAIQMYDYILKMIMTKESSQDYDFVRNQLLYLHRLIRKLQKFATKRNTDVLEVKRIRDHCFREMTTIYDLVVRENVIEEMDIYLFLLSINEKLVSAMKRSHTGNDKIISADGCFCRGFQCALLKCSKACIRACLAEPKLIRYFCSGSSSINESVPIEALCNGKDDCPSGDDEGDCKKDICRKHHLVVLRHNLQDAGERDSGTSMGEALKLWKVKVTAALQIAENKDRPTLVVFRDIVRDILHDLVKTYSTIEDPGYSETRRNYQDPEPRRANRKHGIQSRTASRSGGDRTFNEFYRLSRVVMDTLRTCGK